MFLSQHESSVKMYRYLFQVIYEGSLKALSNKAPLRLCLLRFCCQGSVHSDVPLPLLGRLNKTSASS
jgi:hypothetical protein